MFIKKNNEGNITMLWTFFNGYISYDQAVSYLFGLNRKRHAGCNRGVLVAIIEQYMNSRGIGGDDNKNPLIKLTHMQLSELSDLLEFAVDSGNMPDVTRGYEGVSIEII